MRPRPAATFAAAALLTAALALAGCGSAASTTTTPPSPHLSAATACADFSKWTSQFPSGPGLGARASDPSKAGGLLAAVAAAPSGQLYTDLKALYAQIGTAAGAAAGVKEGEQALVVSAAQQVESDCTSVNPGS